MAARSPPPSAWRAAAAMVRTNITPAHFASHSGLRMLTWQAGTYANVEGMRDDR